MVEKDQSWLIVLYIKRRWWVLGCSCSWGSVTVFPGTTVLKHPFTYLEFSELDTHSMKQGDPLFVSGSTEVKGISLHSFQTSEEVCCPSGQTQAFHGLGQEEGWSTIAVVATHPRFPGFDPCTTPKCIKKRHRDHQSPLLVSLSEKVIHFLHLIEDR